MLRRLGFPAALAGATVMLASVPAHAQQAGVEPEVYGNVLVVLGIIAVVYLLSYLLLHWLTKSYGFVTGVQYVFLGMLLVPLTGWVDSAALLSFEPLMSLAVGAVALSAGLEVSKKHITELEGQTFNLATTVTLVTLILVVILPIGVVLGWTPGEEGASWLPAMLVLGAFALVADGRQLSALARFFNVEGATIKKARDLAWVSTTVAVICFGLVFSFYNPGPQWFGQLPNMGVWLFAHLLVGGLIGALGGALLQARPDEDRALTILLGLVITASAVAYVTTLSIVFVNFLAGVVLINMTSESLRLKGMLESANAPLYILLLFFVGTMWSTGMPAMGALVVGLFLVLRFAGRALGVALYRPRLTGYRPDPGIHRTLWAPGALTAAMILDFAFAFAVIDTVAVVVSVFVLILIAEEIISFVLARGWMIDVSDTDPSRRRASPWGDWKGRPR